MRLTFWCKTKWKITYVAVEIKINIMHYTYGQLPVPCLLVVVT